MPDPSNATLPPLKCIGIILCEAVYRVHARSNLIIVNTFHTLGVPKCPCRFPKITALYTLTGGHGTYNTELAIVHAASEQEVLRAKDPFESRNPLAITDVQIVLYDVPFKEPGKYWMEVRCDGEVIGQRPFYVDAQQER